MQTTTSSSICPLCKSPSAADANSLPSRLCAQCRSMLSTILPQAVAGSVVIVDAQKTSAEPQTATYQNSFGESLPATFADPAALSFETPEPPAAILAEPTPQTDLPVNHADYDFQSAAEPVYFQTQETLEPQAAEAAESTESYFFQTEANPEADYGQPQAAVDSDYAAYLEAAQKFDAEYAQEVEVKDRFASALAAPEEELEPTYPQAEEALQPALRPAAVADPPARPLSYFEPFDQEADRPTASGNFVVAPEVKQPPVQESAPQSFYQSDSAAFYESGSALQATEAPQAPPSQLSQAMATQDRPTTPDMPYAWDNSVDNYPVLMVQEEKGSLSKTMLVIAATALLALAAAGYWFVYKPLFGGASPEAPQHASKTVDNSPPAAPPSAPASSAPAPQPESSASSAVTPPEGKPTTPDAAPASSPEPEGQGKISLQAASFPSEQAANEFSEKLKRSGVPSYIASADISGKGRWYRVRVGRFASPAEAEKYAAQAKQRAKASGLNLQLVVCDYTNQ
jgi:cell division septation protein DedD